MLDKTSITCRQVASSGNVQLPRQEAEQIKFLDTRSVIFGQKKPLSYRKSRLKGGGESQVMSSKASQQQFTADSDCSKPVVQVMSANRSN